MGVMLTTGLALGLMSGLLEIFFFRAIPPLHALIKWNQAIDISVSFGLTYLLSGGDTIVAMIGGSAATLMTSIWWHYEDRIIALRKSYLHHKTEIFETIGDFFLLIYKIIRFITTPIRWTRRFCNWIDGIRSSSSASTG